MKQKYKINKVILSETKNLMRSFTNVQDGGESGRSMVEMLGVLAVIGVLSVAGIAGYTTAMRSYRTNEIVNAASMLYVMAMAQNAGNGPTANVGYTDVGGSSNPSGVSALEYNKDNKSITITFTDPDDCTMAANKLGDKAGECSEGSLVVTFEETKNTIPSDAELLDTFRSGWVDICAEISGDSRAACESTAANTTNEYLTGKFNQSIACAKERWDTVLDATACCDCLSNIDYYGDCETKCVPK